MRDRSKPRRGKNRAGRNAVTLFVTALVAGCAGGGGGRSASLADVDPSGGYWAIRATCPGGRIEVEFRPGEELAVPGLGYASSEEIAVECGDPVQVEVTNEELRRRKPTGADLAAPTFEPMELSCVADGPVVVSAHPVWAQYVVAGSGLRVESDGHTIVSGAVAREAYNLPSELRWSRALCGPA
jgi:hypothetical protein